MKSGTHTSYIPLIDKATVLVYTIKYITNCFRSGFVRGYIYMIKNKINGKVYIGQTTNYKLRVIEHKSDLKHNRHGNKKLQNAVNKYGLDKFNWILLSNNVPIEKLNNLEIACIKHFNSFKNGYNATIGGDNVMLGENHPNSKISNKTVVDMFNYFMNNTVSIKKLSQIFHIHKSVVRNILHGKTHSYLFKEKDIEKAKEKIKNSKRDVSKLYKSCIWNGIEYKSIKDAATANNTSKNNMSIRISKGYTCDDDMPKSGGHNKTKMVIYNGIKYNSVKEAATANGIAPNTMTYRLKKLR